MSNYQHILLPFKLHDHRFQPHHHIAVRFAPSVPVVKLVVISIRKVVRVRLLFSDIFPSKHKAIV